MACSACEERRQKMADFINKFGEWLKRPYSENMTVLDWFLFLGMVLVAVFVWTRLIRKVID